MEYSDMKTIRIEYCNMQFSSSVVKDPTNTSARDRPHLESDDVSERHSIGAAYNFPSVISAKLSSLRHQLLFNPFDITPTICTFFQK